MGRPADCEAAAGRRHRAFGATICDTRDEWAQPRELARRAWQDSGVMTGTAEMSWTAKTPSAAASQDDSRRRVWAVLRSLAEV